MAAKASATNHLPDPSGRATTRRGRFPESSGGVVAARDASRRLLVFASALHAASPTCLLCFLLAVLLPIGGPVAPLSARSSLTHLCRY